MKETIIYINEKGESLELSDSHPFLLLNIEGIDGVKNNIVTQKSPYQDGVTSITSTIDKRDIVIEGALKVDSEEELISYKRQIIKSFNPKLKGKLIYKNSIKKYEIECEVETAPAFSEFVSDELCRFIIFILCPDPFWKDVDSTGEEIVTWIGGMRFPLRLGTTFATKGPKKINIINQGDVDAPVRIEFHGPATNPKIINNTTSEYIKINKTLASEDVLVITTDYGNKRVEINEENVFNWIDPKSTFWQLQVGDNVVEYTSDDSIEPAAVKVIYKNRYLGV